MKIVREQPTLTVLLTGFSAFPGARSNPTEALVSAFHRRRAHFARNGIRLEARVLPVVYSVIAPAIAHHVKTVSPDIILHFGLAARRSHISVETLARNRVNAIHWDAAGRQTKSVNVLRGGPSFSRARIAVDEIAAALRRAGFACRLSNDAGDYLCNAVFYLSLATPHAPFVGFIHVPSLRPLHRRSPGQKRRRLTLPGLLRAAELTIFVAVKAAWRNRAPP